jgi:RNA polymerase sigma-70 factor (ECF subfamily)
MRDSDVVVAVGTTEDAALRALFDQHAAPLMSYALRLTAGDRGRAEDVVQETLLRAWRHPEALDEQRGPVRSWLFTVARNVAVDAHRARRARPSEVGDDALALVPAGDEIEHALDTWLLADAMSSLTPDHRAVLVETYYRGRSVAEAASALGVPAGTVKSRAFYALRALKLALEERGVTA